MKSLRKTVDEYLKLRRGLGFKLDRIETRLGQFLLFIEERRTSRTTTDLTLEFATQDPRLARHAESARTACPSLTKKRVTPHVLRHTAAMELLQAGVDRALIAIWLGHEYVETTQVYLDANLTLKRGNPGQNPFD